MKIRIERATFCLFGFGVSLSFAAPAYADPISATIVAAIGLTGTVAAVATVALTLGLTYAASKLLTPSVKAQDRQASIASLSIGEHPREALFGIAAIEGTLSDRFPAS